MAKSNGKAKATAKGANNKAVEKSDAIREVLTQNPKLGTAKVVSLMAEKGIKVSYNLAYYVKSRLRQAKRRQKRERVAEASLKMGLTNPVQLVLQVKALAHDAGGFRSLMQLVDAVAEKATI